MALRFWRAEETVTARGNLSDVRIVELIHLISQARKTGALAMSSGEQEAVLYFRKGELVDVRAGQDQGLEALSQVVGWSDGLFEFRSNAVTSEVTIDMELDTALTAAARIHNENKLREQEEAWRKQQEEQLLAAVAQEAEQQKFAVEPQLVQENVVQNMELAAEPQFSAEEWRRQENEAKQLGAQDDEPALDALEAQPVQTTETEPVQEVEAEPVQEAEAEPLQAVEAQPVEEIEAEPVQESEAEPVQESEAEPQQAVEAQPEEEIEEEPVRETEAEPVQEAEAEPLQAVEAQPVEEIEEEPVRETEAEPVQEAEAEPQQAVEAQPEEEIEAEPVRETEAEPVQEAEAEPVQEAEAEPVQEAEAEPQQAVEAQPVEEIEAEPAQEAAAEPVDASGVDAIRKDTRTSMATLKEELAELANVEGILSVVVISRDGFVVDGANTNSSLDQDAVGALVSSSIRSSEKMGQELQVGGISHMLIECEQGIISVSRMGHDAMLATVADASANIGTVRYQIKRHLPTIQAAL